MKITENTVRCPRCRWPLAAAVALLLAGTLAAPAFTTTDRSLAYGAYNNNMYFTLANGTQGYYRIQDGSGTPTSFWQFAEQIELACDAADTTVVNQLCTGFTTHNGTDWSGNAYNDDIMWAAIAFTRAYLLTGNTTYRTLAKNGFNTAYNRGYDTVNGGMWWNTSKQTKNACVNFPAAIAGYLLYTAGAGSTYRTKGQNCYTWGKNNFFVSSSGLVKDSTVSSASYTYNQGTFGGAAYYFGEGSNATLSFNYVKNTYGTAMQGFGTGSDAGGFNGICLRWMAKAGFDTTYLRNVCNQAWGYRNSRGLTSNDWTQRSSDTASLYSWDCSSMVVGLLCVPPG